MKNATLDIQLNHLTNNAQYAMALSQGPVLAVVKNDAYHFGLTQTIKAFYTGGIRDFATTSVKEAEIIRSFYKDVTIFLLNATNDFDTLRDFQLHGSIPSLDFLKTHYKEMKHIAWHLEWAGDMRRSGCRTEDEFFTALRFAKEHDIHLVGIWTHFAWADEFDPQQSYENEKAIWQKIQQAACAQYDFSFVHAQNSASFARDGKLPGHTHIRPGILLYGCLPYQGASLDLQHVCTLRAEVLRTISLRSGESIGYCAAFRASEDVTVAVINIGYGDGLLRSRIKGHDVLINGKRYPLVSLMMSHCVALVDDSVSAHDQAIFYGSDIPVHEYTFLGVGANSEQISAFNHHTLTVNYLNEHASMEVL